ncbi:MAG: elongation factor 1-beta [Candidatus Bathyarchaeia archaeon]|nr:elongation factor 1-beta [Candidatus Bathyarchaeia archaeon]MDI6904722.1 elongation factor 1-beta [Candidatus Bathyarchaeia archaeon]
MGSVVVSYKLFPIDITVDFNELRKKIEGCLPEFASIYGFGEEPIAFGLNVLIAHIKIPEDKSGVLDELEKKFEEISEISQVQPVMVRRTSR